MSPETLTAFALEMEKISEHARVEEVRASHSIQRTSDLMKRIKPGDLLFTAPDKKRKTGFLGKVVDPISEILLGTSYGHTAIYAGDGKIIEGYPGGVRKRPLTKMMASNNVIAFRVDATKDEVSSALDYAHSQIGKEYSLRDVARSGIPVLQGSRVGDSPEESSRLQCAALVANAYAKKNFSHKSRLSTLPVEIMESVHLKPIAALARFNKEAAEKVAFDPIAIAGGAAVGKIMLANALHRHGHRIPALRRIGQEIAGVGYRTAQQGKPMLSRPFREAAAVVGEPTAVGMYEKAHAIGRQVSPNQLHEAGSTVSDFTHSFPRQYEELKRFVPGADQAADFIRGIPTESKGIRKVVDYGFTPVSQVGRDIGGVARSAVNRVSSGMKTLRNRIGTPSVPPAPPLG